MPSRAATLQPYCANPKQFSRGFGHATDFDSSHFAPRIHQARFGGRRGLKKTFDTSVWLSTTGMLLGSKADMDDVVRAVEKIQKNAAQLKSA